MLSIGKMARLTGVKIPTIRYYEEIGMLAEAERSAGNQRRYDANALERLKFIRHARDLGFSLDDIRSLIDLHNRPGHPCSEATEIAERQLVTIRERIARLLKLEAELSRIATACDGASSDSCKVLHALTDHNIGDARR
ncbi:helix-turn-helix domain-containing protein [Primorskyibacter aestuariivivens]|uniref:MerR family transcriptional regulator n=1 Tax=Primorskyibacter aestuariivivens TaxID=1888912 RepID=UPI0023016080|nr:helix-turn-helix domain-containing protein [Primorskyibacter aestuariivivens]MDA7427849.1 helix-turn-helix domain-containing protein [Primorskyibacter aestuariivivens]